MGKETFWDKYMNLIAIVILIIGIIFIIWGPVWFTNTANSAKYNFTETGNIGSTIGGITAPIVGIMTALLMYLAFYSQFKANKKQWRIIIDEQTEKTTTW